MVLHDLRFKHNNKKVKRVFFFLLGGGEGGWRLWHLKISVHNLLQADADRFVDDGSLEDNVDSFLSPEAADPMDRVGRSSDVSKGTMGCGFYNS